PVLNDPPSLVLNDPPPSLVAEVVLGWAEHWRSMARGRSREPLSVERLRAALGDGALIEFVRHEDRLLAVVVRADRCVLHPLGSYTAAAEATIRLRYGLRRAGLRDTGTHGGVAHEAGRLADQVLGPLVGDLGDGPVVVVPTGALHTLPWPVLPSFRGRAVCVASSATAWLTSSARLPGIPPTAAHPTRTVRVAAVAGPGLDHADTEAAMVLHTYKSTDTTHVRTPDDTVTGTNTTVAPHGETPDGAVVGADDTVTAHGGTPDDAVLTVDTAVPPHGEAPDDAVTGADDTVAPHGGSPDGAVVRVEATVAGVLGVLERAEIVHVAAHGYFCVRSPLLSSIALEDGPLMAYDLLRVGRAPWLVVLSACDAGMAHAPVDGAPLGLAGAFLEQGTSCVIAGLVPVRDDEALTLMTLFHTLLISGRTPAEALATASEKTGVSGFACFGSHGHPLPLPWSRPSP
ncbi:CHAT domain-containing protein, partial [Sphaerisporangium corydalis]